MSELLLAMKEITCMRSDRSLISHLSFELYSGEILQVVGDNGSGKTSLLRIISGLLIPQAGKVYWRGKQIQQVLPNYFQQLHYLGHHRGIKLDLTVLENLKLDCRYPRPRKCALQQALHIFQLSEFQNTLCRHLSHGQCHKVALAKLLLSPATLWLLDEPLQGLDALGVDIMRQLFQEKIQSGGAIILSTHQPIMNTRYSVKKLNLSVSIMN